MELVQDLILLHLININMSILSYFGNNKDTPHLFVKARLRKLSKENSRKKIVDYKKPSKANLSK